MFDFIWKLRNNYYGAKGRSNFQNSPLKVSKAFEMNLIALSNIGGGGKKKLWVELGNINLVMMLLWGKKIRLVWLY